jgi:hypothetical protein
MSYEDEAQVVSAQNVGWPAGKKVPIESSPPTAKWLIPDAKGKITIPKEETK